MEPHDHIQELGLLVIDHRLRRIVDRLLAAQAEVYAREEVAFEPRWTSTFSLLEREGPLGITEIAARLRLTHPAVIKQTDAMLEAGLLAQSEDEHDQRRRVLRLTQRARRLAPHLHQIWEALAQAQGEVFHQAGWDALATLTQIEVQMNRNPIATRVERRLKHEVAR